MFDAIRNAVYASLGAVALTTEKLREAIDDLVRRGELSAEQGRKLIEELMARGRTEGGAAAQRIAEEASRILARAPFTSRAEIERLEARVRALEARLGMVAPDEVPRAGSAQGCTGSPEGADPLGPEAPGGV